MDGNNKILLKEFKNLYILALEKINKMLINKNN